MVTVDTSQEVSLDCCRQNCPLTVSKRPLDQDMDRPKRDGGCLWAHRIGSERKAIMKENVFDVLIYLFEKFMDGDIGEAPDTDGVRTDLMEAGFPPVEIAKALNWLDSLHQLPEMAKVSLPAFRIYAPLEEAKLDSEARGLLMFLEQTGILSPENRELVIDRLMALDEDYLSLDNLKWIVLMVLFSRPDEEIAFARMEHLVYGGFPATLQ
jgi:Smg protein